MPLLMTHIHTSSHVVAMANVRTSSYVHSRSAVSSRSRVGDERCPTALLGITDIGQHQKLVPRVTCKYLLHLDWEDLVKAHNKGRREKKSQLMVPWQAEASSP